jgi:hypothetical protein
MVKKLYNRIDVSIFEEAFSKNILGNPKISSLKHVLSFIQKKHTYEYYVPSLNVKPRVILENISWKELGFRSPNDYLVDTKQDVFEKRTKVCLIPKILYDVEGVSNLPKPINDHTEAYQVYIVDIFERVKIKAENILHEIELAEHIELYATKNIQLAVKLYGDSLVRLKKLQQSEADTFIVFNIISLNFNLLNLISYLQDLFKGFYKGEEYCLNELRSKLLQSIGNRFIYSFFDCTNRASKTIENNACDLRIKWNGQINTLITLCYDLMHYTMDGDSALLECSNEDIKKLLTRNFVDKRGKSFNPFTIETCMNDTRKEKRASGRKRIKIPTHN